MMERVGPACPTHAASSPTEPLAARPAAEMIGGVSSSMQGYGPKRLLCLALKFRVYGFHSG